MIYLERWNSKKKKTLLSLTVEEEENQKTVKKHMGIGQKGNIKI